MKFTASGITNHLRRNYILAMVGWTVLIGASLAWNLRQEAGETMSMAVTSARSSINKDILFRKWVAFHGGVYVPPTQNTPPNPYLKVPDRDVVTSTGKALTLMNPAYALRELQSMNDDLSSKTHITSLKLLNPHNVADEWESAALKNFEQLGNQEAMEVHQVDGLPHLRVMRPFTVAPECLKCHEQQGYKVGELRGGISADVSLETYRADEQKRDTIQVLTHGFVWLIGLVGVGASYRRERRLSIEKEQSETSRRESEELFSNYFSLGQVGMCITSLDQKWLQVNSRLCELLGYTKENLVKMTWTELTHPDDLEMDLEQFRLLASGEIEQYSMDKRFIHKSGKIVNTHLTVSCKRKPDNKIEYVIASLEDITNQKLAEATLRFHSNILNNVAQGIYLIRSGDGAIVFANPQFERLFGYESGELLGKHVGIVNAPSDSDVVAKEIMSELAKTGQWRGEVHNIRKDGTTFWCYATVSTFEHPVFGMVWISAHVDITERKRIEESLRVTASVFDISQEAIIITDALNNIVDVNPAFTSITGYSREEVIGKNPSVLNSGRQSKDFYESMWNSLINEGAWRGETWNRRKSGEMYPEVLSISLLRDSNGKVLRHVAVFSDISNLKEHEAELVRVAHFDALTSIPNRILLADRMRQAISQTSRDQCMMAVCYLDLDGFKPINDVMGHQTGDEVLIEIAKRIGITIRGGDTVARLGGDEFVVLLLGLAKGEECVATLERLLGAIAAPIVTKGQIVSVSASIGVSIYPLDEEDPDTLLRHADQAMYVAKQSGKNRFHIYDVELDKRARDQNDFLKSIRKALEQNQFELHYQPKVNLQTRKLVGAEALIRWRHPEKGLLSPVEFLRHIENTDLDIAIGEWVIAAALAQIHHWQGIGLNIEISINISGYHLESEGFVEKLQQQLANYNDSMFGKLQLEVLETVALEDITAVQEIIESCRKIGVGSALDDFGTGYSSLSYLSVLPVDTLKIDQSFVRDMLEDKGDMAIVQGIIALAKAFKRETVAEGIETEEHYKVLLDMGCEIGQGYGIARPMPAEDLAGWQAGFR